MEYHHGYGGENPLKVIIADDEPIVLEGLRWLIDWTSLGFELVGEAYDGEDALKLMETHHPDLVITDIRMPVIDGLDLIRQASKVYPGAQFIILSGYADFEYARQAIRYGVSNYLTKPLDDAELTRAVKAAAAVIRLNEAEQQRLHIAAQQIREDTVTRLVLGETEEEWVRSSERLLDITELTRVRCVQWLAGPDKGPHMALVNPEKRERVAVASKREAIRLIPFRISEDHQGFILLASATGGPLSDERVNGMMATLRDDGGERLCYAVSGEHRGPLSLHRAYLEAVLAGICKPPSEEDGVYYFHETLLTHITLIPEELKAMILKALAEGNPEGVRHFSGALSAALALNQTSEGWTYAYLSTIKLEALQVLMEHGADGNEWTERWFSAAGPPDPGTLPYRLMEDLAAAAVWVAKSSGLRSDSIIQEITDYIKLHYPKKLKLQQVADHVHMNPAYLGQRIKKLLGVGFNEYLHSIRTEEAKKLLRRTDLKITDIAIRVGYPDADQFLAKFKAITGMTPSAYKKGR